MEEVPTSKKMTKAEEKAYRKQERKRRAREETLEHSHHILAQLTDGRTVTLMTLKSMTVAEVKQKLCLANGYDADQHGLMLRGNLLNDTSTLAEAHVKKGAHLKVAFTMQLTAKTIWDATSSASEEHLDIEIEEDDSDNDEVVSSQGSSEKSEDPEEALRNSLRKALISGSLYAGNASPRTMQRELSRQVAIEKGTEKAKERHRSRLGNLRNHTEEGETLTSVVSEVVSEVAQRLLPNVFLQCIEAPAKHHSLLRPQRTSFGGA